MVKDRIAGAAKQVTGTIKVAAGKAFGNADLVAEGRTDKIEGKVQSVVGDVKDALKK